MMMEEEQEKLEGRVEESVEPEEEEPGVEEEAEGPPSEEPESPPEPFEEPELTEVQPSHAEPAPAPVDPIQTAIERRARELSMSGIVRPETLARKLRESIVEIVGPEASVAYHIGAELKDGEIKFQIARLGPHLLAKFTSNLETAELAMAYRRTTSGGWQIGVGITASTSLDAPAGSELTASFAVTVSR